MKEWLAQQWKLACNGNMLLVLDEHKAQTTNEIRRCQEQCNTLSQQSWVVRTRANTCIVHGIYVVDNPTTSGSPCRAQFNL